jgi:hypothetical protein
MQRELDSLRSLQEKFVIKTRELEIDYDDLERTERFVIILSFILKKKKKVLKLKYYYLFI